MGPEMGTPVACPSEQAPPTGRLSLHSTGGEAAATRTKPDSLRDPPVPLVEMLFHSWNILVWLNLSLPVTAVHNDSLPRMHRGFLLHPLPLPTLPTVLSPVTVPFALLSQPSHQTHATGLSGPRSTKLAFSRLPWATSKGSFVFRFVLLPFIKFLPLQGTQHPTRSLLPHSPRPLIFPSPVRCIHMEGFGA